MGCVLREGEQIGGVAGQDDASGLRTRCGGNHGVERGHLPGASGQRAQASAFPSLCLAHRTDLTGAQQAVHVEVPPMVAGQRFGQHHGGHLSRPEPATLELSQPRTLTGQAAQASSVQDERHAGRPSAAIVGSPAAQAAAARLSSADTGPSSASSSSR